MFIIFFRTYFVYLNCIYIYKKAIHCANKILSYPAFIYGFPFLLASATFVANTYLIVGKFLFPFIIYSITFGIISSNPCLSCTLCLISYVLSYGIFTLSGLIITIILSYIFEYLVNGWVTISIIAIGFLQSLIIHCLFHHKRLKNGMPFLYSTTFINCGTFLSLFILSICTIFNVFSSITRLYKAILILCVLIVLPLLMYWWQSQLTKTYRKRLAQLELESLRTELEQKTALLKKLETQNEEMGRLIHKDNKLIPAMEHAVSTYLASGFTDIALQQAQGEALLSDLKEFSEARRGILSTFAPVSAPKYNTGIPSLDAILVYMYQKAQVQGIRFYAAATPESIAALPPTLTTEKLVHMLSDLLENAIIATKTSTEKQIQVQIYLANGLFTIEVADTGCSFEPATLISFGLEKASTHLTEGGSGIGLLDIWKIKEETKASIHIHEYETGAPFSKKLFITFDKKNKYVIHTWRDKELSPLVNRGDIVILPQEQV